MESLEESERRASALQSLEWLLGEWALEGEICGKPVRGRAAVERAVQGAALLARERVEHLDGRLDYEDLSIYTWDDPGRCLRVHHFAAQGGLTLYTALPLHDRPGLHWIHHDLAARVVFTLEDQGFTVEVWPGADPEPVSRLRYRSPIRALPSCLG